LLVTRIITGAVLGVVITVTVLFLPTPAAAAILGLLWLAGAWEWAGLVGLATGGRAFYTAGVAVCMAAGLLWLDTRAALLVLILALLWWLLAFGAVLAFPRQFSRSFVAVAGLVDALRGYAEDWSRRTAIVAQVNVSGERQLPLPVEQPLFRVAQEALANVARHSRAQIVTIYLAWQDDTFTMTIADDGRGFDTTSTAYGMGLGSMQERLAQLNGRLTIHSKPGQGSKLIATLPLPS
jgi:hypothetical protein